MNRAILLSVLLAGPALPPLPATVPPAAVKPEALGFDAARLARLPKVMQGFIDRKELPGMVLLVLRDGKTVGSWALGTQDVEGKQPMRPDTIFRIASMSKAVTSVAVLILVEEGRVRLDDPLSKFIPEFKGVQVAVPGKEGEEAKLSKAVREISIRDLLTHRSGISYGFNGDGPVQRAYRKLGVSDGLDAGITLAENMARLAQAPLVHEPGKAFHYGLGTDVLGRVVEVASGQDLDAFLRLRIFAPLKMKDSGFTVPADKLSRLAEACTAAGGGGIRLMQDPESFGFVRLAPGDIRKPGEKYLSGGAGLASTASDYARFCQMLLNRGTLDGARILAPKTVDLFTASATHDLPFIGSGHEFGLGVGVLVDLGASGRLGTPGSFSWSGIYGTSFWVDPKERLLAVLMAQRYPYGGHDWQGMFRTQVYQALVR
jgi:CubicO group peptidase (beta-lactamase class C family)